MGSTAVRTIKLPAEGSLEQREQHPDPRAHVTPGDAFGGVQLGDRRGAGLGALPVAGGVAGLGTAVAVRGDDHERVAGRHITTLKYVDAEFRAANRHFLELSCQGMFADRERQHHASQMRADFLDNHLTASRSMGTRKTNLQPAMRVRAAIPY
eukprot:jgi/Mesvir1/26420/Mv16110-RA.1